MLRLPPDAAWALTPAEAAALARALAGPAPLDRAGLEALIMAHPDGT